MLMNLNHIMLNCVTVKVEQDSTFCCKSLHDLAESMPISVMPMQMYYISSYSANEDLNTEHVKQE